MAVGTGRDSSILAETLRLSDPMKLSGIRPPPSKSQRVEEEGGVAEEGTERGTRGAVVWRVGKRGESER